MSLYNALFGENKHATELLESLGLEHSKIARYRDCFLNNGKIIIYTKTGGKNWEDYTESNQNLMSHPCFLKVDIWEPDKTYASFYFNTDQLFPSEFEDKMPIEKWEDFNKRHQNGGPYTFLENAFNQRMEKLTMLLSEMVSKGEIDEKIILIDREDIDNPGYNVLIRGKEINIWDAYQKKLLSSPA